MRGKDLNSIMGYERWLAHRKLIRNAYFMYRDGHPPATVYKVLGIKYDTAKQWYEEYLTGRLLLRLAKGTDNRNLFNDPRLRCWLLVYKGFSLEDIAKNYGVNKTHVIRWMKRGAEMIEWGLKD